MAEQGCTCNPLPSSAALCAGQTTLAQTKTVENASKQASLMQSSFRCPLDNVRKVPRPMLKLEHHAATLSLSTTLIS